MSGCKPSSLPNTELCHSEIKIEKDLDFCEDYSNIKTELESHVSIKKEPDDDLYIKEGPDNYVSIRGEEPENFVNIKIEPESDPAYDTEHESNVAIKTEPEDDYPLPFSEEEPKLKVQFDSTPSFSRIKTECVSDATVSNDLQININSKIKNVFKTLGKKHKPTSTNCNVKNENLPVINLVPIKLIKPDPKSESQRCKEEKLMSDDATKFQDETQPSSSLQEVFNKKLIESSKNMRSSYFQCSNCHKFRPLKRLSDFEPNTCDLCESHVESIKYYQNKIMTFNSILPKAFDCAVCEEKFAYRIQLNLHFDTHSAEEKARSVVECDFCPKKFLHRYERDSHVNSFHVKKICRKGVL